MSAAATFEGRAMGSRLRFVAAGLGARPARLAWQAVADEFEASERALSRWRTDSDLSQLNATAGCSEWVPADRRLMAMLHACRRAQRLSGGRFDPRVIKRLEEFGERAGVPLPELAADLGSAAPWLFADPRRGRVRLQAPVDSGGIGKGLALRWAAAALRRRDLLGTGMLIEAGGDVVTHGARPGGGPWQVGMEDPDGGEPLAVISVGAGAIATSSTAVRQWRSPDGASVHHLIDPSTGEPGGDGLRAVTVATADPAWAEVWSKTLFLAGRRSIGDEARRRGLAAWWVEQDGSLHLTPAARQATAWTRTDLAA